jgi:hypothetical protein
VKLQNQLTNNPEVIQLLHASFLHWNDPDNCSNNIWLPQEKIVKLTPDQHGTIEEVLMSFGMVKGFDPTGRLSFFELENSPIGLKNMKIVEDLLEYFLTWPQSVIHKHLYAHKDASETSPVAGDATHFP